MRVCVSSDWNVFYVEDKEMHGCRVQEAVMRTSIQDTRDLCDLPESVHFWWKNPLSII